VSPPFDVLQGLITRWATRIVTVKQRWPQADTHPDEMYLQGLLAALHILRWPEGQELDVAGTLFVAALALGEPEPQEQPVARAA